MNMHLEIGSEPMHFLTMDTTNSPWTPLKLQILTHHTNGKVENIQNFLKYTMKKIRSYMIPKMWGSKYLGLYQIFLKKF